MEQKEIKDVVVKKGIEMLSSVHRDVKTRAASQGILLKDAVNQALIAWLNPPVQAQIHAPATRWHQMLSEILSSGDKEAVEAIQYNLSVFHRVAKHPTKQAAREKVRRGA